MPSTLGPATHGDLRVYRDLFEHAGVGLAILSPEGELLESNAELQRMLGHSAEELKALGLRGVFHPDDPKTDQTLLSDLLAGRRDSFKVEKRLVCKDGEIVWGRLSVSAQRDAEGRARLIAVAVVDVTSSKDLENRLAESRRRYFELFDNALVAIFRTNAATGEVLEANRRAAELVGLSGIPDLVGLRTSLFFLTTDERTRLIQRFRAGIGTPVEFESPLRAIGGRIVWIHGVARVSLDGAFVDVVAFDVTERRLLEEERAASEKRLSTILETTPTALLLFDKDGRAAFANRAAENLLGRTRAEISGWRFDDGRWGLIAREGPAMGEGGAETPFARVVRTGKPLLGLELTLVRGDGERRLLSVNGAPLPAPFGGVVVSLDDITERRAAEEALQRERRVLDEVIVRNPYGIGLFDADGRILRWNDAFIALFGAVPPHDYSLFTDPVLERAGVASLIARLREGETIDVPPIWYNPRLAVPWFPDRLIFVHAVLFPTLDAEGRVEKIVAMYEDVTVAKRAEDALRKAKEEAETADRAKTEFLSIASHELRTPLTPLRLLIQQSRRRLAKGVAVPEAVLVRMEQQVARLTVLVTGLLDVSRLTRGVLSLERRRVDLRQIVAEVIEDYRGEQPERTLRLALPADAVPVSADTARVEQVLAALIDNALKYSPAAAPVDVSLEVSAAEARVTVTDQGPGVPEPLREKLFTGVLVADERPSRQPGLGLGLFLARQLVELHGGSIGYRPAGEKGSVFFFTLPLAREEAASAPALGSQ